jgi:hypothetical protein
MDLFDETVTSVFGKISRRELLKQLAFSGLALGLGGSQIARALTTRVDDDPLPPPKPIVGLPFRDIRRFQTYIDDKFDIRPFQSAGVPKPRTREVSWLDKPTNAAGVGIWQFTNTPSFPLNSCAQAAVATMLNFYKMAPPGLKGDAITDKIYTEHPPDGGERGTSFRKLVNTKNAYGMKTWSGRSNELGEETMIEKLKTYVSQGRPVTVLVDLKEPQGIKGSGILGHFAVVFAYSDTHVYLTNWNYSKRKGWKNDWDTFKIAWSLPEAPNHHMMAVAWA